MKANGGTRNGISWIHYAKVFLNEQPDVLSFFRRENHEALSWNIVEVNFLLFPLYEKRDFYSNSFLSQALM